MNYSISKMKSLIEILNHASDAYYLNDRPIMSDKQYDDMMDMLATLENETGVVMSNSPLHKVQGKLLDGLDKVTHTKPMLSADKTKDMDDIAKFIGDNKVIQSWKLDGLTIVVRYENGQYKQAITRGNGEIGEDVTESIKHCINLPLVLSENVNLEIRGECVISWDNFKKINESLNNIYSHPRNLAAGSVRCLDTNTTKDRYLEYKPFELVHVQGKHMDVAESFEYLAELGFDVVDWKEVCVLDYLEIDKEYFNPESYAYPVDGTIYKYDSYQYGKSLGVTAHHPLDMIARKWNDELFTTTLLDIEWNATKSGVVAPVAVFKEVDLDGALTTRATLHNVSCIEELELGIGDIIQVYRANGVIPKIHDNLTRSNTYKIIDKCPSCGGYVEIWSDENSGRKTLHCVNAGCKAQILSKLIHFCSRNAMNIDGLSEATLDKFIDLGFISAAYPSSIDAFVDIYKLSEHYNEIANLDGFGKKSADNLMNAIEKSKKTTLDKFLFSLSIPNVGRTASKAISKCFNGMFDNFYNKCVLETYEYSKIDGFGNTLSNSLNDYIANNYTWIKILAEFMEFDEVQQTNNADGVNLSGITFVITGKVNMFSNRDELKDKIESLGGNVVGSVSCKVNYLINNDIDSSSSKNKKAKEIGIPIITEQEFINMLH